MRRFASSVIGIGAAVLLWPIFFQFGLPIFQFFVQPEKGVITGLNEALIPIAKVVFAIVIGSFIALMVQYLTLLFIDCVSPSQK